jgi:Flp pilus assembly protein TadG
MRPKAHERGQALVIIALAAVGLFGFSALAIDGSRVFSDRRNAQNAADTAALSAALAKIRQEDYVLAARNRAADNGYIYNPATNNVEVAMCNTLTGVNACQGIPTVDLNSIPPPTVEELARANAANYINVKITSLLPATFGRIVGRNEFKNVLSAIAYAGPVEPKPLVDGYAIAAMERHDWDAINHTGNFNLEIQNSGIFSNSDYASTTGNGCQHGSMSSGGNAAISVDTAIFTVGTFCAGNNTDLSNVPDISQVSAIEDPPTVDIPNFSCSGGGSTSYDATNFTLTYHPGSFGKIDPDTDAPPGKYVREAHFSPGTYCISNGASFNGAPVVADGVRFLVTGGAFKLNGSNLTCNDMMIHVNGGSGLSFSATSHIYCNNVTFFLSTGGVSWSGNPEYRLYAPTGGDYEGLLFYMPPSNSSAITINGNASCEMTGTILAVSSPITINGNNWTNGLNSQIIGDTVRLEGNGNMVINYDPDDQYNPIDPSSITLTK